jgi:hypothetical protein
VPQQSTHPEADARDEQLRRSEAVVIRKPARPGTDRQLSAHEETLATQVRTSRKRSPCTGRRVEAARTGHSRESSERSSSRISNESSIRGGPATAWSAKLMMVVYRFVLRVRSPFSEG